MAGWRPFHSIITPTYYFIYKCMLEYVMGAGKGPAPHIQFYLSPKTIKAQMALAILHARRPHPETPERTERQRKIKETVSSIKIKNVVD